METEPTVEVTADLENAWETVDALVSGFVAMLPQLIIAAVVFVLFWFLAMGVRALVKRLVNSRSHDGLGKALGRLAHIAVVFAGFLVAVGIMAPSVGAAELLSVLGVGSVAIGFAFRDILQNFLAGILILIREPFIKGDWVQFGDHEGIVQSISTRSTWIRTFDGRDIAIPNGEVFTNAMMVVTKSDVLRGQYDFGIAYDADLKKAMSVILDVIQSHDKVLADPQPDVGVVDLAGSSVNIRGRWWTHNGDYYRTKLDMIERVKLALDENDIAIPFPTRTLELSDDSKSALGAQAFKEAAE